MGTANTTTALSASLGIGWEIEQLWRLLITHYQILKNFFTVPSHRSALYHFTKFLIQITFLAPPASPAQEQPVICINLKVKWYYSLTP